MKTILLSLLTLASAMTAVAQTPVIDYRFDEVRRKVTVESQKQQAPATVGSKARSGDFVQTGWFSYALIATELYKAKFEIFSSTKVELTSKEPGVLLSLERGKLQAIFDKITGSEPRVVKTPGALLAVRGTKFTIEVGADGDTEVDVHEGVVEVRSPLQADPLFVRAGEYTRFSPRRAPGPKPIQMRGTRAPQDGAKPRGGEVQRPPRGTPSNPPPKPGHGGHGTPQSA